MVTKHSKALYEDLRCEKCKGFCHPPFLRCRDDHLNCQRCYSMNRTCQICDDQDVVEERLYFLQLLHSYLDFPCENTKHGCTFEERGEIVSYHQLDCPYVVTECLHMKCNWIGNPSNIIDHYRNDHIDNLIVDQPDFKRLIELKEKDGDITMINVVKQYDKIFRVDLIVTPSTGGLRTNAFNFEPFQPVNHFYASIEISMNNGEKWPLRDRCRFVANYRSQDPSDIIICNESSRFKKSTHSSMYFEHTVEIKNMNTMPMYMSDSSSYDENGNDEDYDDNEGDDDYFEDDDEYSDEDDADDDEFEDEDEDDVFYGPELVEDKLDRSQYQKRNDDGRGLFK
ncbi:hypothetical protein HHI36_001770 [Cryptolaemus montrouzieri]|uniref:SIAH-type domain-containing protein n=1 Tax=Cryptolaemus montrouzieri TaxID=559131 RepID=A0ABD2P8R6_9CUCU